MAKWTILSSLTALYTHITICCCYKWISTLSTFKEPNSQPLYRIVEENDDVYVAGRNVLYRLSTELDNPVKFVTGPELDHPRCFLDQPCDMQQQMTDNDNQVLDVLSHPSSDSTRRMLLVCGTLYHGLCQLRDLQNISEYRWIGPYNYSLGFLTTAPTLYRKTYYQRTVALDSPVPARKRSIPEKSVTVWWSALRDDPAARTLSSPPFLSSKRLVEDANGFHFKYSGGEYSGTFSTIRFEGNATRYTLQGFEYSHYVYFVIVHTSGEGEISTRLARLCLNLQTYGEMTLTCTRDFRIYNKATAVYYGNYTAKIKRDHQLDDEDDMLYLAMARLEGDEVQEQVICGFHMRAVAEAFNSNESSCFLAVDPIKDADCLSQNSEYVYKHNICGKMNSPYLLHPPYMSKIVVGYVRTSHFTISAFCVQEQHGVGITIIGTSNGFIIKGNNDQKKIYAYNSLLDGNESRVAVSSPLTIDKNGLHIYFVVKHKVVKYPLYSCAPHQSCSRCVVNGRQDPLDCGWCNGQCTQASECEDSTSFRKDSCPPHIQEVIYGYPSAKKGTVFTISGYSFGSFSGSSHNNVTVSDLDCETETWNNTQVTCTLTTPLKRRQLTHTVRLSSSNLHMNNESLKIVGSDALELNLTHYRYPKLYAVFPSKGPTSGGTHVVIYGENLDTHDHRLINVRGRHCTEIAINDRAAWCITDKTENPKLKDTISLQFGDIVFELEESVPDTFNMTGKYRNFTYLPDPQIYQIQPGVTTISGLMNVTVVGRHLDSVETPELVVRVALSQSENVLEFKETCWSDPDSKGSTMSCRTPSLRHPGLPLPTRSFPLITHATFLMDGVEELRNLDRTKEVMTRLMYYPDPEITRFRGVMNVLDNETMLEIKANQHIEPQVQLKQENSFRLYLLTNAVHWHGGNLHTSRGCHGNDAADFEFRFFVALLIEWSFLPRELSITGRHLDLINNPDNLHVRIDGHKICKIIYLHPNSLHCKLPSMLLSNSAVLGTNFTVEVIVGVSTQNVGIMSIVAREAETSAWILIAIVGGSCIVIGILIWYCWRYKKTAKKPLEDLTLTSRNVSGNQYARQTDGGASAVGFTRQRSVLTPPCEVPLIAETEPLVKEETLQLIKREGLLIETPLLILGKEIGSGQFGCVFEGLLQRPKDKTRTKVAVKTLRNLNPVEASEKVAAFLEEALVMKDFKHLNVLSLIGISFEGGLPLVVLPYMENGDLCTYIRDPLIDILKAQLLQFAVDVATGMAYLAKIRFVHRDLAARNCVLDSKLSARVADFGLSRDIYEKDYYSSHDTRVKLPCKWMAPESLEKGVYSEETDVWSYGVLLWELMSHGVVPYANVIGWDILPYVKSGRRLPQPDDCPEELYALMHECWKEDPNERPCFEEIKDRICQISTELIDEVKAKQTTAVQNPSYM